MQLNRRSGALVSSLYLASSLAAALGLLMPLVALGLVLAYGFGHVGGTFRLFLGYLTLTTFAFALPPAIRLGQTLRIGALKVSGAVVQRSAEPRRFWARVAIEGVFLALRVAAVVILAWVTLR